MKKLSFVLMTLLFSHMAHSQSGSSYDSLWKQIEKLEKQDLTQSALKVAQTIQEKAKKESNTAQTVKSLLFISKYAMVLEENAQFDIVEDFKKEIENTDSPTKNILHNYLANLYWQYLQQNRYRFYGRTEIITKVDQNDFRTWDVATLFSEINYHFQESLKNEELLQNSPLKTYETLLSKQENSEKYRPTLFDLLAHNALDFYKTSENSINQPAYKFEILDEGLMCEAYDFAQKELVAKDSTSLQLTALQTYQDLIKFHFQDPEPFALTHVDIDRLKFTLQNAIFENKNEIYIEVLKNTAESLKHHEVSALYGYEIAQHLHNEGNSYDPQNQSEVQWKQKEALEICEEVIANYPDSYGAEKCKALQSRIQAQSLQLTTENFLPINQTARLLVNYKNVDGLELSAHAVSTQELEQLNKIHPQEKRLAFIQNLKSIMSWSADLKNEGDFQQHGIEVKIPPMPNGRYLLLARPSSKQNGTFAYSELQVTNLAIVETKNNTETTYQLIDRNNGQPVKGAEVKISYLKNYNKPRKQVTEVTNELGLVTISLTNENWSSVKIEVDSQGEKAVFGDYYVSEKYINDNSPKDNSCFLFTDRSIYRPGQPLYFKGIATTNTKESSKVLPNTSVTVELIDVNGQTIGSQKLKTNEFGSFSGEFALPSSVLTGEFSLQVDSEAVNLDGYASFSVEEYKRPKFETSFNPVKETFQVNDSITVTGKAESYAGSNITQAKVNYRVKRVVNLPRWYSWSWPRYPISEQEITHGETETDANGNYSITFRAIPDLSISKETLPTFEYEITADVTDINGETQSTSQTVKVGYHSLNARIQVAENLQKDQKTTNLTITTTNLNGEFVPAKGVVKIYKLSAPNYVLRQRPWPAPDYQNWNKEDFKELFPHDAYKDEQDFRNWPLGKVVKELNFDTEKTTEIQLEGIQKWPSGKYLLQLETKDKFGSEVKDKAFTTLHSEKDKVLADNQLFDLSTDKENYEIGDAAEITLSSNADHLSVSVFVEKDGKKVDERIITLNGNSKTFKVKIDEADLGGFAINHTYAAYNSFESGSLQISVPYPKTDLEIETLTFRDKIAPGSEESWSFKIKGPNGDQISSELLASMYDASLDAFRPHSWSFSPLYRPIYYSQSYANAYTSFGSGSFRTHLDNTIYNYKVQSFDSFNFFGLYFGGVQNRPYSTMTLRRSAPMAAMDAEADMAGQALEEVVQVGQSPKKEKSSVENASEPSSEEKEGPSVVSVRTNLQETAFFYPHLQTDKEGNVSFSFTSPEALTRWKLQLLAHTKNLNSTVTSMETLTQKELMVIPNTPRFLREGDEIQISTKIANLTNQSLSGNVYIELTDAVNGKDLTPQLLAGSAEKNFEVDSSGNAQASWRLQIPEGLQAVQYKIVAKAGDYSDGEQNLLPVLTNRMLVTETLPMWVRGNETKKFELTKLKENSSSSLEHHKLTLEVTSNPAWYAVQALPYLMEYPYECNEQIFSRFYANSLASHIINSNPRMKNVFEQWKGTGALKSNLEKNEELKSLLIQETPWLRDAQSESEQKKRMALLFELNNLKAQQTTTLAKLVQNQKASGAWAWFQNGPDNRTITQHIVTGLGHLKKLQVAYEQSNLESSIQRALQYLDDEFVAEYERMKKHSTDLDKNHLSQSQIHYLYMRSFFNDYKTSVKVEKTMDYYWSQAEKHWTKQSLYSKGMLALALSRHGNHKTAQLILRSLKENSVFNEELGRYWKNNTASWYWYQAPIETQSLLIEAFEEITQDTQTVDELKIWLLKNKQTNQWATTKATTEAIYSLLLSGSDWVSVTDAVEVTVGNNMIDPSQLENVKTEAGTGYFKTSWEPSEIQPEMAQVEMTKKGDGISWGALYWQYFEDLDKITSAETPLKLKKLLFLKTNTDTGEKLVEITNSTNLKVGDLVRVRIELCSDREMEFVHMKDMRAAGFEPVNVLSSYKWQDGLGYYESTKDASTNFFFDRLPKGVFVFEYDLRVNNAGEFSNGITTVQSMYAPEFSSHSEGNRVKVEQ
ncbi:MAG: alpha-2-macroglobulin [Pseudozobellia sp.]|nr:alpha-2-macroglobulin [Pseudozobellia sp.]MBG48559.1 alpha-2-macroglobulin [Pseudozobellia sp.]